MCALIGLTGHAAGGTAERSCGSIGGGAGAGLGYAADTGRNTSQTGHARSSLPEAIRRCRSARHLRTSAYGTLVGVPHRCCAAGRQTRGACGSKTHTKRCADRRTGAKLRCATHQARGDTGCKDGQSDQCQCGEHDDQRVFELDRIAGVFVSKCTEQR